MIYVVGTLGFQNGLMGTDVEGFGVPRGDDGLRTEDGISLVSGVGGFPESLLGFRALGRV